MNKFLKKITGHKFDNRYKWGEFYWRLHPKHWNLSLQLTDRYGEYADLLIVELLLFSAYIYLPTKICPVRSRSDMSDGKKYGFYIYQSLKNFECLVLCWGNSSKHIDMPWTYEWFSLEILDHDYTSIYYEDKYTNKKTDRKFRGDEEEMAKRSSEKIYDYTYVRENGEIQKRKATVIVERMGWTMRGLPFKKKKCTSIWVTFDEAIGERVDTWKGGVTGSGTEILLGETPLMALRRMEIERKFK